MCYPNFTLVPPKGDVRQRDLGDLKMEIRDVIGNLRLADLEIIRKIDALRLDIHLLRYRLDRIENPCPATDPALSTKEDVSDGDLTPDSKPARPSRPAAKEARVGAKPAGRKPNSGSLRG